MTDITHTYVRGAATVPRPRGSLRLIRQDFTTGVAQASTLYQGSPTETVPAVSVTVPAGTSGDPEVYAVVHDPVDWEGWVVPVGWLGTRYIRLDGTEGSSVALTDLTPYPTPEAARAGAPVRGAAVSAARAAVPLLAGLESDRSVEVRLVSDSTGTDRDEWFGLLGALIGQAHPTRSVWWQGLDDSVPTLVPPLSVASIQDGAAGRRALRMAGTGSVSWPDPGGTGDLQVTVIASPAGGTWDGISDHPMLANQLQSSGTQREWYLQVRSGGTLRFRWSEDGAAYQDSVDSTSPLGDDVDGVRATLDVDDGSSQHVVTLEATTDAGATWTVLDTVTRAGATSIHDDSPTTDQPVRLGYGAGFDTFVGDIHWVEVRRGDLSTSLVPGLPERWVVDDDNAGTPEVVGAPVVLMTSCANSGDNLSTTAANWTTEIGVVTSQPRPDLLILQSLHNEQDYGSDHANVLDTWLTLYRASEPRVPVLVLTGNPKLSPPHDSAEIAEMQSRRVAALTVATARGDVEALDTWPVFAGATLVEIPDGTHPSAGLDGGAGLQARYVAAALGVG